MSLRPNYSWLDMAKLASPLKGWPLGMELASRLEKQLGRAGTIQAVTPPSPPPPSHELVESKMMQCERCDAGVALLIFADQATDHGGLEDYARKMYPQVQQVQPSDLGDWATHRRGAAAGATR